MFTNLLQILFSLSGAHLALCAVAFSLVGWRTLRFTIWPYFHPNEPVDLPYWLPFFAHSFSFFGNSDRLLERGLNHIKRTHKIYAVQTLHRKLYIITDPADVAAAFKDNTALHFDGHLNELLVDYGFSGEDLRRSWHLPQPGD
ncbi:hypothetical protein M011DRAFT_459495 [Sporormia fimetaria CBS 119925]|uniref:Cytochrome P450 n=1 Tax=Sporormia fimetaria CBS 119925 TaxID=1340428 RepID=A0A6A6V6P9_9PLEO|nr:hypothetical protein M011DRAFT_459495 [Sporormia fimetaria CBS 119925]